MDLSIIIPVRDEAGNVGPLAGEIARAVPDRLAYEVIFVDDGSVDATGAELVAASGADRAVRVLRHTRSCGQSAALWTGLRAARGRWIATLDGDGQNDPADIPRLLSAARAWPHNGAPDDEVPENAAPEASALGIVAGVRTRRRDSRLRRLSSRIANGVRSRLLGDGIADTGCGLKLIRREAMLAVPFFDHVHRFLPALIQAQGWGCLSAPVNHRPRAGGRSKYGTLDRLWVGIVDLFGVLWLTRRIARPELEGAEGPPPA